MNSSLDCERYQDKSALLRVSVLTFVLFFLVSNVSWWQLYVQDLKVKRDKILKDKRDIVISEEDEVDFFKRYCREFFGRNEDPVDVDDDLLYQIWEEIRLEGF